MAAASSLPVDATPALSQVERLSNTIVEPSKTFLDIRRNRSWWLPFLILAVLGYCFMGVAASRVGWPTLAANAMKNNPKAEERMSQQTPEQRAQTMSITQMSMKVATFASPVIVLASAAVFALLLWFGIGLLLGGTTDFRSMFAVVMYAMLPTAFVSVLGIVSVLAAIRRPTTLPRRHLQASATSSTPTVLAGFARWARRSTCLRSGRWCWPGLAARSSGT